MLRIAASSTTNHSSVRCARSQRAGPAAGLGVARGRAGSTAMEADSPPSKRKGLVVTRPRLALAGRPAKRPALDPLHPLHPLHPLREGLLRARSWPSRTDGEGGWR